MIKKLIIPAGMVIVLLILVAWMANLFEDTIEPGLVNTQSSSLSSAENTYFVVTESAIPRFDSVPSTMKAKQQTIISSRILARILKVNVRAGDSVKQGALLVELEKSELVSNAAQAEERANAIAALRDDAELQLNRVTEMFQRKLVAKADVDSATARYQSINADLASAKQAYKAAMTTVEYSQILSPINGRVVDRFAEPGDTASPGAKLIAIYNPLSLRVESEIREQIALSLKIGQILEVSVPALGKVFKSTIDEIVPAANPGSRSFLIKSSVDYDEKLLPGMFVRLQIPTGIEQGIMIPKRLISEVGQLNMVHVKNANGTEKRIIRLGRAMPNGLVIVQSGISLGDSISERQNL